MSNLEPDGRLELTAKEMRGLGYKVVDMLVKHFEQVREKPGWLTR